MFEGSLMSFARSHVCKNRLFYHIRNVTQKMRYFHIELKFEMPMTVGASQTAFFRCCDVPLGELIKFIVLGHFH